MDFFSCFFLDLGLRPLGICQKNEMKKFNAILGEEMIDLKYGSNRLQTVQSSAIYATDFGNIRVANLENHFAL